MLINVEEDPEYGMDLESTSVLTTLMICAFMFGVSTMVTLALLILVLAGFDFYPALGSIIGLGLGLLIFYLTRPGENWF